jgi:hypothetical protein
VFGGAVIIAVVFVACGAVAKLADAAGVEVVVALAISAQCLVAFLAAYFSVGLCGVA